MAEKKRLASIELLRILAMVMVVVMHFMRESDSLLSAELLSEVPGRVFFGTFLEAFCIVAVNAYVFISGYFGCRSSFKLSKVIAFLCQIWFYSLLIPLVPACLGQPTLMKETGIYGLLSYVLPIESESYWFATSYFLLLLLQPVLNAAADKLTRKQFQMTIFFLLILFCGIKSICPLPLVFDKYGYDLFWFVCVYLVAAYLRIYGGGILERHPFKIYGISCILIFAMTAGLWKACRYFSGAAYYFTVPFHYNFIFCLTGAAGLFYGFLKISLKEGRGTELIRRIGKYSFGIYLFHEHPDIRYSWYPFLKKIINPMEIDSISMFFAELIFSVVILFAAGLVIEWIRNVVFGKAGRLLRNTAAGRFILQADEEFKNC